MDRLSDRSVTFILETIARAAGILPVAAHDMRRTFITTLLDRGVDLSTAQRLAGHRQVTTTTKYDRRGEKEKAAAVAVLRTPFSLGGA
jgi:site-specific recombinase XerD